MGWWSGVGGSEFDSLIKDARDSLFATQTRAKRARGAVGEEVDKKIADDIIVDEI